MGGRFLLLKKGKFMSDVKDKDPIGLIGEQIARIAAEEFQALVMPALEQQLREEQEHLFTEAEAAAMLGLKTQTLADKRRADEICCYAHVKIHYSRLHIAEYLMRSDTMKAERRQEILDQLNLLRMGGGIRRQPGFGLKIAHGRLAKTEEAA